MLVPFRILFGTISGRTDVRIHARRADQCGASSIGGSPTALATPYRTGCSCHLAIERPEGGLRYIDIWETEEDCDRFGEQRLHPVVHGLLSPKCSATSFPTEPARVPLPVVHVWGATVGSGQRSVSNARSGSVCRASVNYRMEQRAVTVRRGPGPSRAAAHRGPQRSTGSWKGERPLTVPLVPVRGTR